MDNISHQDFKNLVSNLQAGINKKHLKEDISNDIDLSDTPGFGFTAKDPDEYFEELQSLAQEVSDTEDYEVEELVIKYIEHGVDAEGYDQKIPASKFLQSLISRAKAEIAQRNEPEPCSGCSGTGEGSYSGSRCMSCGGSGIQGGGRRSRYDREDDDGERGERGGWFRESKKSINEYSYTDNYPGSWGYRESINDYSYQDHLENVAQELKTSGMDKEGVYNYLIGKAGLNQTDAQTISDRVFSEGLNPDPLQATEPSAKSVVEADSVADLKYWQEPFKLPKMTDPELDYDPAASRFEPDYMKTPGEEEDDEDDFEVSMTDDEWEDTAEDLPKHFTKRVSKDKERFPFLQEQSNPPYGFSVLSPDERKQLKEYIESVKTIKKEIAKLAAKAGKKVKTEGGNMTGLIMKSGMTSEAKSANDISSKVPEEVYTSFKEVIKDLRDAGLTDSEIKMFLDHEIEEKGKGAAMSQYDLPERKK